MILDKAQGLNSVSTHSRTKAAASKGFVYLPINVGFNTQPHEGGCIDCKFGCATGSFVSTHSRTKAAAFVDLHLAPLSAVSTHSRTKAAA